MKIWELGGDEAHMHESFDKVAASLGESQITTHDAEIRLKKIMMKKE